MSLSGRSSNKRGPAGPLRKLARGAYRNLPFKQPIFELTRRAAPLPEKIYRHLHFRGVFKVKMGQGTSFLMRHHGYQVENDLFWAGYGHGWEATSLVVWSLLARRSSVVLDIGANTGVYALAAKAINPQARVVAFEPIKRIADRLRDNVGLNGFDVAVVEAGASDSTGEAVIFEPSTEHAYSASLDATMLAGRDDLRETRIAVTRIDDLAREHGLGRIDLVKLDAEKHEMAVLTGFGDMLMSSRPTFLIEILDAELGARVAGVFADCGYLFYEIVEGQGITLKPNLGGGGRNHLVCPREVGDALRLGDGATHRGLSELLRLESCSVRS